MEKKDECSQLLYGKYKSPELPLLPHISKPVQPRLLLGTALYLIYPKISVRDTQILINFLKICLVYGAVPKFIQVNSSKS